MKVKRVEYDKKSLEGYLNDSGPSASTVGAVGGGVSALSIGQPSAIVLPIAGVLAPWVIGLPIELLSQRKIHWDPQQIAMTPEEEWAAMTPVEQATSQVDKALKTWDEVRKKQESRIHQIDQSYQSIHTELTALQQEQVSMENRLNQADKLPEPEQARVLEGESPIAFKRKLEHLVLRVNAKQKIYQEQHTLLEAARKVYQALDEEIKQREQTLLETRETLQVMDQRNYVLEMHQQLQTVKGTANGGVAEKSQDLAVGDMALEVEKQRIQMDALMQSIQTAMDVEGVLNKIATDKAAR